MYRVMPDHRWRTFLLLFEGFLFFVLPAIEGSPFMVRQTLPRITSFLALRLLHPHEKKCKTY